MNEYNIIKADIKRDKNLIISLLKSDNRKISSEIYDWKYFNYPYGLPQAWILVHNSKNNPIGCGALFRREISCNGEKVIVANTADLVVDKKYRSLYPAIKLGEKIIAESEKSGYEFIYSYMNEPSKNLYTRLGYKKIGNYKMLIKILNAKNISNKYLPGIMHNSIMKKSADFFSYFLSKEFIKFNKKHYKTLILDTFDNRIDSFWCLAAKNYRILSSRTKNYLTWRYTDHPFNNYKLFCILNKEDIIGYIIFFNLDNLYYIEDIIYIGSKDVLNNLLQNFLRYARVKKAGGAILRIMGDKYLERTLRKYNFFIIEKAQKQVGLYSNKLPDNSKILNERYWHFLRCDKNV